jgi:hypothetical protein
MSIDTFRQNFKGVRGNRFKIFGNFPGGNDANSNDFEFYARAASVPGSAIGIIPVGYKGRPVKFSGERTYTDWAVQVYDSSVADIRGRLEAWIDTMDSRNNHEVNYNLVKNWEVHYHDMSGTISNSNYNKKIKLINCFPVDLSPIELSYDTPDTFAEFTLTLTFDYWTYI